MRSASKMNIGASSGPVSTGIGSVTSGRGAGVGRRPVTADPAEGLVHAGAEAGLAQHLAQALGEAVDHLADGGQQRAGVRFAPQAQQQQVAGPVGVEGGLGVELQLDPRRGRGLATDVVCGGQQVLHDLAAVLGRVAHGLAQPPSHRQQG